MREDKRLSELVEEAVELLPRINNFVIREDQYRSRVFELTISQLRFLRILHLSGETTMGKLSEALNVAPPSATTTAERLVKQGLIVRKESPKDRRVVKIALSQKGKTLMRKIMESKRNRWADILLGLTPSERENMIQTLQHTLKLLEKADEAISQKKS